ncbi:MAG: AmmeMemoRadiSam system protein B [Burkholderiales bacterium]
MPKDVVRAPAVAGSFYPYAVAELQTQLDGMLAFTPSTASEPAMPKALIVPHAGYVYSGLVAASAYAVLRPFRKNIARVVLLGPTHRKAVRGLALPASTAFATPLGQVPIDTDAATGLRAMPQICTSEEVHALEHSLEVHLPFLQRVLDRFQLVPLAVGDASTEEVAQVLNALWGGEETLIVVSSDLSHYLPYDRAREVDEQTASMVLGLEPHLDHQRACGATPVNGLLQVARERGLRPQLLDLRNSGDTAGDRNRVVGYASFAFYPAAVRPQRESGTTESAVDGKLLVSHARASIASQFGLHFSVRDSAAFLHKPGASFVTLKSGSELRGCIGTLTAHRELVDDVRANACAAAFKDPRFAPLRFDELSSIRVEVSLLSELERMHFQSEADALEQMRPGIDGLMLEFDSHRGTFLPQVWENLPEPRRFLGELKRKAGLPADFWDPGVRLSRYTVAKWSESES